jgi:hypothetical protein
LPSFHGTYINEGLKKTSQKTIRAFAFVRVSKTTPFKSKTILALMEGVDQINLIAP